LEVEKENWSKPFVSPFSKKKADNYFLQVSRTSKTRNVIHINIVTSFKDSKQLLPVIAEHLETITGGE
jgi:hypothetical protein